MTSPSESDLYVGRAPVSVEDLLALARFERAPRLWADPAYRARLDAAQRAVERRLDDGLPVYGVTTGVGSAVMTAVPAGERSGIARFLVESLGGGTGRILDERESAAVVAARLVSLASGHSGVRPLVLERLCDFLNARLLPRIPEQGSVGASGDLAPLLAEDRDARFAHR